MITYQFCLFRQLTHHLGSTYLRTTVYHPAANGFVERFHQQLKSTTIAIASRSDWSVRLPVILIAIRNTIKEDLEYCLAELVFGIALRVPAKMILDSTEKNNIDLLSYTAPLKDHFRFMRPIPTLLNIGRDKSIRTY